MLRRITIAYTVNELGNWLGAVALTVAVFDHTGSAIATAALFVCVRFLPALTATPVVAWLESLGRRRTLFELYCLQALTTGGLAALLLHPILAPILVLAAIDGTAALVARALLRAVVSQEAGDAEARRRANGRLNIGWAASGALGPAVGGALTALIGAPLVLVVDVASFAATAVLMFGVASPTSDITQGRIVERLRSVRSYVVGNRALAWLLGTEAVAVVFFASVVPVEVVFVKATLHAGDSGYGALVASWGAGMLLGGGIFARARKRPLASLLTISTAAVAVAYLGIGASTMLWVASAFSFIGGTGNGVQWITLITAVQEETPRGLQGGLMGVVESMSGFCLGLGFMLGGAVAAVSDPRGTFIMAGAAAALATGAFALLGARGQIARPRQARIGAGEGVG